MNRVFLCMLMFAMPLNSALAETSDTAKATIVDYKAEFAACKVRLKDFKKDMPDDRVNLACSCAAGVAVYNKMVLSNYGKSIEEFAKAALPAYAALMEADCEMAYYGNK
jgi:hypothetical protein